MRKLKTSFLPQFSALLLMTSMNLLLILQTVHGQQNLDAGVQILTGMDEAGDTSVYHFTIKLPNAGDTIRTYLPNSVLYTGYTSADSVEVCQESSFLETIPIQNCVFDTELNMIEFIIPDHGHAGDFFEYELGYLRNPFFSQILDGFKLQILDSSDTNTVLYQNTEVWVRINSGTLTNQSLQTESAQVAAETKFTFQFTVTNPVPSGGSIEISFPLTHFEVPSSARNSRLSVDQGPWFTPEQMLWSSGIRFSAPSEGIGAGSVVTLEIDGMTNPNTMEETDSFSLTTLTSDAQKIDSADNGFFIQVQNPAEMTVKEFSISSKVVGKFAAITIALILPTVYEAEGYLTMTLPPTVKVNQASLRCQYYIGFASDQDSGQCNLVNDKVIRIDKNISQKQITFRVSTIVNPANTMKTDDFVFHIYDPVNNMIASTEGGQQVNYTPVPAELSQVSITRPDPTVGIFAQGLQDAFQFTVKSTNMLQSGEVIQFKIPKNQMNLFEGSQMVDCMSQSESDSKPVEETCQVENQDSYFYLRYSVSCPSQCQPGSTFKLFVTAGIKNPNWITTLDLVDSIEVFTLTDDLLNKIDEKAIGIFTTPDLQEGLLQNLVFNKNSGKVGDPTDFSFSMTTLNAIPAYGYLRIDFQEDTLQLPESGDTILCQSVDGNFQSYCQAETYSSGLISTIEIREPCGLNSECPIAFVISLSISNVRNPRSTKQITNKFKISTFTQEGYAIDKGDMYAADVNDLQVEPAIFTQVTLVEPNNSNSEIVTGMVESSYLLQVQLNNGLIAQLGQLLVAFPDQVSIQSASSCLAYEEVSTVLLDCFVLPNQNPQTVIISHQNSGQDYAGQNIMVKLQNSVRNPPSTKSSDRFQIQSKLLDLQSGIYYIVDQLNQDIFVTPNKANTLQSATITRSNAEVSTLTDLRLCIIPKNPVPANAKLTIVYPTDQAIIQDQQSYRIGDSSLNIFSQESQKAVIVLQDNIQEQTELCIDISNGIMNPDKTSPPQNSFQLTLQTSENFMIDQTLSGIFAQDYLSAGSFLYSQIESFGNIVGDKTEIKATLQLKSALPPGSLFFIRLPNSAFYKPEDDSSIECAINDSMFTDCKDLVTNSDEKGDYIASMKIQSPTQFFQEAQVTLHVRNLRNKFDSRQLDPIELEALIQSYDDNEFTINTSNVTLDMPQLVPNSNGQVLSAWRSDLQVQGQTIVNLEIQIRTRLLQSSTLRLHLSSFLFVLPDAALNHITCKLDTVSKICSISDQGGFYTIDLDFNCPDGALCADDHMFSLTIHGLKNRYSTYRGKTPDQEVYFETFDKSSEQPYQVDFAIPISFIDELVPGSIVLNESSLALSERTVGQITEFTFTLEYLGMQTFDGDSIQVNIGQVAGVDSSGQLFLVVNDVAAKVKVNNNNYPGSMLLTDSNDYITSLQTAVPASNGQVTIKMSNVQNLGKVVPLSAEFTIFLNDQYGGQIAKGTALLIELEFLRPIFFSQTSFERKNQELASATDIEISIDLTKITIMKQSVLKIFVPKDHLDLDGDGKGRCRLLSKSGSRWQSCSSYAQDDSYVISTLPMIEAEKGSKMTLRISNVFSNPQQVTFSNKPITFKISNEGYAIGESEPNAQIFVVPPLSKEELSELSISQDGLVSGQQTEMVFDFTLKNQVPNNSVIIISLPEGILLYEQTKANLQCETNSGREIANSVVRCEIYGSGQSSKYTPLYASEIKVYPQNLAGQYFMQRGSSNKIVIKNAFNPDFAKDRSKSNETIFVSIVSPNGFVVAQDSIGEWELPSLDAASILVASMTRESIQVGENQVVYELIFDTPNAIQSGSYAIMSVPRNEIKLRDDEFSCEDARTRNNMICEVIETSDNEFILKISNLCEYQFCQADTQIVWQMELANSDILIFEEEARSIQLQFFTSQDYEIQKLVNQVKIGPPLEGNRISQFEMERKTNLIGGIDYLKFYVPPMQVTIFSAANLILELPHGIAYSLEDEMVCLRELEDGEQVKLDCEGVAFADDFGPVLRSVRIIGLCDQYYVCFANQPLNFQIKVRNPATNQRRNSPNQVKVILRQEIGLDVGSGQQIIELPAMVPNKIDVTMHALEHLEQDDCYETGAVCYLLLNITTANTLKDETSGAYLEVRIPGDLKVQGDQCWAMVNKETDLACQIMTRYTIHIRAPFLAVNELKEAGNQLSVIVESVRMPVFTAPISNPVVQSFEMLPSTQQGSRVFSLVDTNEAEPGFTQLSREPSKFKNVEVLRENSDIGWKSSLRLSVQAYHQEALQIKDKEVLLEIQIPVSAGTLKKDICYSGKDRPEYDLCRVTKEKETHLTLLVSQVTKFCPARDLYCRIYLPDFINSDFAIAQKDQLRDSFSFTLFYELDDEGTRALIYKDMEGGIFAEPILGPLRVDLSQIYIEPAQSYTAQEIAFNMRIESDREDVFDSPYLMARFAPESFKPMFSYLSNPYVFINEIETTFQSIETIDLDMDTSISALFIDIPSGLKEKVIDVRIIGFKNPNYIVESYLSGTVEIQVLGSSIDRWQSRAIALAAFDSNILPAKFDTLELYSSIPWPGEQSYLDIDLSMTNQIERNQQLDIEIKLPKDYQISQTLDCDDLLTQEDIECQKADDDKILVKLSSSNQNGNLLSFMAASFRLGPILNPTQVIQPQAVSIRVIQVDKNRVYVEGSALISVKEKGDQSQCPIGCDECATDGSCYTCQKPSATPLIQISTSQCHSICPEGTFQSGSRCLKCNEECSTCHSLGQCSSCFKDESKIFVDGRCLNECPENTVKAFQTEAICVRAPPKPNTDDKFNDDQVEPVFQKDWEVENLSPCSADNCKACGLSSEFCTLCEDGFTRSDGKCLQECKDGFFSTDGICFKCSPMCKTCSETANRCDSCHDEGADFSFNKLLKTQRICASVCPPGTFEKAGVCQECSDRCNTCQETADTCTSCFHDKGTKKDLYLYASENSCKESCSSFTQIDFQMHICQPIEVWTLRSWPMIMLIASIASPICLVAFSGLISKQQDEPWELSLALLSLVEGGVKASFWITLWQAQNFLLFCFTGVSILCSALFSVIFYESTFLPVLDALDERRKKKSIEPKTSSQLWAIRVTRILAYLSNMNTMRLVESGFCGFKAFQTNLTQESPCFFLKRRVQANKVQILFTAVWSAASIASLFESGLTSQAVGAGFTSIIVSIISLLLQIKLFVEDKGHSAGYRSLQTSQD